LTTELEIGFIGTDFSRRTSWWARENPGRARTWKSMKNDDFCEMYSNTKMVPNMCRIRRFLDETGRVLDQKMMPDVAVMVPELEIDRQVLKKIYFCGKMGWAPNAYSNWGERGGRRSYHGDRNSGIKKQPLTQSSSDFCNVDPFQSILGLGAWKIEVNIELYRTWKGSCTTNIVVIYYQYTSNTLVTY
jgi:hypothetical protein